MNNHETAAGAEEWPLGDRDGYDVALCVCEGGAYLGVRQMGQPCCCEKCGRLTRDQWDYLVSAAATRARAEGAAAERERIAQAVEAERSRRWQKHLTEHPYSDAKSCPVDYAEHDTLYAAARIARSES